LLSRDQRHFRHALRRILQGNGVIFHLIVVVDNGLLGNTVLDVEVLIFIGEDAVVVLTGLA